MIRYQRLISASLLCFSSCGQCNELVNQYLSGAQEQLPRHEKSVVAKSSWVDRPELRYSGNDDNEHTLGLRFRPRFKKERLAQNRIIELLNHQQETLLDTRLNDELNLRYSFLIDLIETYNKLYHLEHKQSLDEQRLTVLRSQAETESFDVAELQNAEFVLHRGQQQLVILNSHLETRLKEVAGLEVDELKEYLRSWSQQAVDWDLLMEIATRIGESKETKRLQQLADRTDLQLAQQNLKLIRSSSASWLEFVELEVVNRPGGEREVSFGLAIPLGGDDFGIARRANSVNRASFSLWENQKETARSISSLVDDLQWQRDQAKVIDASVAMLRRQYKNLRDVGQASTLLKLKQDIANHQNESRRLHIRGLRQYLKLVHSVGYLAKRPLTNWLLRDQPEL